MSAITQRRRKRTAKETAQALGISERTVRNLVAEAREDYEARAKHRRTLALEMREAGHSWAEIAKAVDGTEWSARSLVRQAKARQSTAEPAPSKASASVRRR